MAGFHCLPNLKGRAPPDPRPLAPLDLTSLTLISAGVLGKAAQVRLTLGVPESRAWDKSFTLEVSGEVTQGLGVNDTGSHWGKRHK
jgi:hypothetical protein